MCVDVFGHGFVVAEYVVDDVVGRGLWVDQRAFLVVGHHDVELCIVEFVVGFVVGEVLD